MYPCPLCDNLLTYLPIFSVTKRKGRPNHNSQYKPEPKQVSLANDGRNVVYRSSVDRQNELPEQDHSFDQLVTYRSIEEQNKFQ